VNEGYALANDSSQRDTSWSQAPLPLTFPAGRVDVWRVHLDQEPSVASEIGVLSSDELARASRFHFERDRQHFGRCRSALRSLLAAYLVIPPADIRFDYSTSGKPQLATDQNPCDLQFNVSHSGGVALIAVGSERRLGIDIEIIRNDVDIGALAERFFSVSERTGLRALPDDLRVAGFYACWTRKEAFLKATGDGLSFPLADFSVTTHPDLEPKLEDIKGEPEGAKKWHLADLSVIEGYRAALATDGSYSHLETFAWN
jgi:4'-phosphopantetheinyl transferase